MTKPLKTKTVHVRLTVDENKELTNLARAMRTDKSGALREILKHGSHLMAKALDEGTLIAEVVEQGGDKPRKERP